MATEPVQRWQPGDVVVMRLVETPDSMRMLHAIMGESIAPSASNPYPFLVGGEIVTVGARPYRVVLDDEDAVVLHQPEDTPMPRWQIADGRYLDYVQRSKGETLRFLLPGKAFDVTLFFEGAGEVAWYYDALFEGEGLQAGWRERRRSSPDAATVAAPASRRRFRGWYVNLQSPFRRMPYGFDVVDHTLDIVVRPDRSFYWKDADELALAIEKGACSEEYADTLRRDGEQAIAMLQAGEGPFSEQWTHWRAESSEPVEAFPDGWQLAPAVITD